MWYAAFSMRRCLTCHGRFEPRRLICPSDKDILVDEGVPAPETGRVLGDLVRLGNLLGEGGMGKVFEATRLRPAEGPLGPGRREGDVVAVKLLKLDRIRTDRERRTLEKRFLLEAEAAASLDSPGIVRSYDYGKLPDGSSYMVLDRLYGATFDELRRAGKFASVERVVELIREVCKILAVAHARGIVHRDLKPSNLFLHRLDRDRSQVKVLDFGIAKFLDRLGDPLTTAGEFVGTLLYMAPEQAAGRPVRKALDVYALGVILFEALAGRAPFAAHNPVEFLRLHASAPPPSLRSLRPEVSAELDEIVAKCLRKKPEHRFADAGELAEALGSIPVLAGPDESLARTATVRVGASDLVGTVLDERFELEEWIARGRFGSDVYRAIHLRTDADVAVRLWRIAAGPVRDSLIEAFRREGRAMRVRHPNLIAVIDIGYTEDCVYVATELVKSTSLREVLDRGGPLRFEAVERLAKGAAEALAALHAEGIVSGGLSPETIRVVTGKDGPERALISPFGLKDPRQLSVLFEHFGSLDRDDRSWDYISPEQKTGKDADARSDVYALAAVTLEMLGGRCAADAGHLESTRTEGGPASSLALPDPSRWIVPAGFPLEWVQFFARALDPDPEARIQSAEEFIASFPKAPEP